MDAKTYQYYNWKDRYSSKKGNILDKQLNTQQMISYMLNRTNMMFEYENLPETIEKRYLEQYLQVEGVCCIAEHNGELFAYFGGFGGEPNEYYTPTRFIISNPYQNKFTDVKDGVDGVVIFNDSQRMGLIPLLEKYCYLQAENEISIRLAEVNTRIQSLILAGTDAKKEAAEKYLNDIFQGKIGSIIDKGLEDGIKTQQYMNAGNTNNITQLIELEQFIKGSMWNELGIQANFNMKRESLNDGEIQANVQSLKPLVQNMLEERQKGFDKVNKIFGTNIKVKLSEIWKPESIAEEYKEVNSDESDGDSGNISTSTGTVEDSGV